MQVRTEQKYHGLARTVMAVWNVSIPYLSIATPDLCLYRRNGAYMVSSLALPSASLEKYSPRQSDGQPTSLSWYLREQGTDKGVVYILNIFLRFTIHPAGPCKVSSPLLGRCIDVSFLLPIRDQHRYLSFNEL